jgi:succinoglycan biosynthesis transport protein ExoP
VHAEDMSRIGRPDPDWVGEAPPSGGLPLYLDVLRSRVWLIGLLVAVSVGAAILYVSSAAKVYEGKADMLITAIPQGDDNLFGLGLVSQSSDPTRDVETLAQLITTPAVAKRVDATLTLDRSARSLLKDVSAEPVAQSSIVTITAKAHSAALAASIANAFGEAAIAERTARLHRLLDSVIPQLRKQLDKLPSGETAARGALADRLRTLQTLRLLPDPTLHLETLADPPPSSVAPRPVLSIAAAFLAALVLGVGAVLGSHMLDTRIQREEELRRYRIPILGRIPLERRRTLFERHHALTPDRLAPATLDAFRRLGSSLASRIDSGGERSIFVTGASPSAGKTTTSINLAAALAGSNQLVILAEADSRRPSLSRVLALSRSWLTPERGMTEVITHGTALSDALEESLHLPDSVRVLSPEPDNASALGQISREAADALVRDAQQLAEWLVFDGPALNYAPEALPIAKRVASVILVIRLRSTRSGDLAELAELLTQQGITPDGFVVIGGKNQNRANFYM